jgi:spore germination protein KB
MKKTVISNHQLFAFTGLTSIGGSLLVASAPLASIAKQDAWLSTVLSSVIGISVILLYYFLGSRHPGMTLIGIIKSILGKWIGTAVAALYVLFFIIVTYDLPWYIIDFMSHVMHETPAYVISSLLVLSFAIAALYGVEVIVRASEIFLKLVTIFFFMSMLMVAPNIKADNLLPLLENGVLPVFKSSVFLSSYIAFPVISILMVYPSHIESTKRTKGVLIKGMLWSSLIYFVAIILSILVLGSLVAAKSKYPTFLLLKEINVGNIFTRLEYFISVIWIVTVFIVGTLFFYSSTAGLSELLRLKNHKNIIGPLALIIFIMSGVAFSSDVANKYWSRNIYLPFSITMGLLIPLLLFLIYYIKKLYTKYLS